MIDVSQWRASIGLWNGTSCQYCSSSSNSKGFGGLVYSSCGSLLLTGGIMIILVSLLLILSGDVELNPGPGNG